MKVRIKKMDIEHNVKTNGIEFEVRNNDDSFRGDCYLTKTGLVWCEGRTQKKNGKKITWDQFIKLMNERSP